MGKTTEEEEEEGEEENKRGGQVMEKTHGKLAENSIVVVYMKRDRREENRNRREVMEEQKRVSAEMEIKRLEHLVNTTKQHLKLMQQKNMLKLMEVVQPTLVKRNLQLVIFGNNK